MRRLLPFWVNYSLLPIPYTFPFASKQTEEQAMPMTDHVHAAEIHRLAAHAHEAAAASHSMNDHLRAHEQSRLAHERSVEAHHASEAIATEKTPADK
jgi:hypothetical protein